MNEIRCLVISSSIDYSTDYVYLELEARGVPYFRINRDQLLEYKITLDVDREAMAFEVAGRSYSFSNAVGNSVFFRAPTFLRTCGKPYSLEEQVYHTQWGAFLRNLVLFDSVTWVNNPADTYLAESKLYQLHVARMVGLAIPRTLATNSGKIPLDADMYAVKSIDTAHFATSDLEYFAYTSAVPREELEESDLSLAPFCVQEYLHGKVDMRVAYINGKLFPFEIRSNGEGIEGDWRKTRKEDLQYVPVKLPAGISEKLCALMRELRLKYGGIDLARCGDAYYFIEANPTGEWCWLQESTGVRICPSIVDALMGGGAQ